VVVVGGREAGLSSLRSLRVVLPSGEAYWTAVDHEYRVVEAADAFLRDLRFGADRTESTTNLYAGGLALFLGSAAGSGPIPTHAGPSRRQPRARPSTPAATSRTSSKLSGRPKRTASSPIAELSWALHPGRDSPAPALVCHRRTR